MSAKRPALIYGLIDPRTSLVFYVGQTRKGERRPMAHGGAVSDDAKGDTIREIRAAGSEYTWTVLEKVAGDQAATDAAEVFWISYGRCSGWPLTNVARGGGRCMRDDPNAFTRPMTFKLPDSLLADLRAATVRTGQSLGEYVREAIELALVRGSSR
jgi:hypothetical protein